MLLGGTGNDFIDGGKGDDIIDGGAGYDQLFGGEGNDLMIANYRGLASVVFIHSLGDYGMSWLDENGNGTFELGEQVLDDFYDFETFRVVTGNGDDTFVGAGGADFFRGGRGDDTGFGNGGNDVLRGGGGHDELYGGAGNDRLIGGRGDDILIGGNGADVLRGGKGKDIFVIDVSDKQRADKIVDFKNGKDKLSLQDYGDDVYLRQVGKGLLLSAVSGGTPFTILSNVANVRQSDFVDSDVTLISEDELDPIGNIGIVLDVV